MWKVTNEVNKEILDNFRYKLIEPLFNEIIYYKKQCFNISFSEYVEGEKKSKNNLILISYSNKRKKCKIWTVNRKNNK